MDEFELALGDEWKLGAGKVDWKLFKPGKVSKEYAGRGHEDRSDWLT